MGLFWDEEVETKRGQIHRVAPPIPETDWKLPNEFPDLSAHGMIALDIETYDPDLKTRGPGSMRDGYIAGIAIGTEKGFRAYYPIAHQNGPNLDPKKVLSWLRIQLTRPNQPKIGANLLYDLEYLAEAGIDVVGPFWDIQVAEPLLDENQLSYSLENIAQRRLGEGKRDEVMEKWLIAAYGVGNIKSNIWRAPPQVVGPYAIGDIDLPLRIFEQQRKELERVGLWELFEMESGLIPLLLAMRRRGVPVNIPKAEKLCDILKARQKTAEEEIKHISGMAPDIWAAESIAKIFDAEGIPYPRTEKTNAPSFRKGWLEQQDAPIAKLFVEARSMSKLSGTFIEGYILNGHVNGRVHCQYHQLKGDGNGAVSGRFASSLPNLQNLPIRHPEMGPLIRSLFEPEKGQQWWKLDWSQIEFRLAVHYAALLRLSGSQAVVDQYLNDPSTDYHKVTAELTGLTRSYAKTINFGIIYGLGIEKLCVSLNVDHEEGEYILSNYHKKLPFVKPLYRKAQARATDKGEIETLLGRKRRFHMWEKGNQYFSESDMYEQGLFDPEEGGAQERNGWKRAFVHIALNALLQGSAADIMKKAMVMIWNSGICDELGAPHLTVHDELDGSLPESPAAREALAELRNIMQTCVQLKIPLVSDQVIAGSWGEK